jgi:hypothetical protein
MANDLEVQFSKQGSDITVAFAVDFVIGGWWLDRIVGKDIVQSWHGRTDDKITPDSVKLAPSALGGTTTLAWTVFLFGPAKATESAVTVRVLQGGKVLAKTRVPATVPAKKALNIGGTITIKGA